MKLFYIQSPYYWRNLYRVGEELGIDSYEMLEDELLWSTYEYDKSSNAKKIRLWDEEKYGSDSAPHNRIEFMCGERVSLSWHTADSRNDYSPYTSKIKDKLSYGDDVILAVTNTCTDMIAFFQSIQKKLNLRLHYIVWRDFDTRTDNDELLLQYLPYVKTAASVVICNSHDLCRPYIISFDGFDRNENWEEEAIECNELFLETAKDYLNVIKNHFSNQNENRANKDNLLLYEFSTGKTRNVNTGEIEYIDLIDIRLQGGFPFETVTHGLNHDNCIKLREYREAFKEKYDAKPRMYYLHHYGYDNKKQEIDERRCEYKKNCRGTCKACDSFSEQLFLGSSLAKGFTNYDLVKDNELLAPINGIDRMRIDIDGKGVRSLIMIDTCYLNCKYCINKSSINRFPLVYRINVMELAHTLFKDIPYFDQTGGGVTFGGGEPLIYADYIHQFHEYVPAIGINIETSLNVELKNIALLVDDVDEWIVDIKDMNPDIYFKYTGAYNSQVINNLVYLLEHVDPSRIRCRVPLIEGFNTEVDVNESIKQLREMGINRIEKFKYK